MRPGPRPPVSTSDIEHLYVAGILFDEDTAWFNLVTHQHREELIGRVGIFNVNSDKEALRWIHRRVPELLGVHLAEALVARELNADFLREIERSGAQLGEGLRFRRLLAEHERERRRPNHLYQLHVRLAKVQIDRRRKQLAGECDRLRRRRLLLDHLHAEACISPLEHGERVAVGGQRLQRLLYGSRCQCVQLDQAMIDHEIGGVVAVVGAKSRRPSFELLKRAAEALPLRLREFDLGAFAVANLELAETFAHEEVLELRVLLEVVLLIAELDLVERGNGDVHVPALEQFFHVPVEERQDQRADVRAVDVGVGHDDDSVVTQARDVELVADSGTDRRDHRLDLVVREHLVDAVLLAVDDLPAEGEDRLIRPVSARLGGPAGTVALDDEEFGQLRVADRAIGELARKGRAVECGLAARQLTRLARSEAGAHRCDRLVRYRPRVGRVLLEELREVLVDGRLDEAFDARIAELRLRLALELGVPQLHGDDCGEPLAHVLSLELLVLLQQLHVLRFAVERARERAAEAGEVRAALDRVDVVRKREHRLLVGVVPLHRHLNGALVGLAFEVDDVLVDRVLRLVDVRDEIPDPALRLAADELLTVDLAVTAHLGHQVLGERVDDRDADAVEAAGDLVAVAAELAAGVELREDDGQGGLALALDDADRDARAPVPDRDGMVGMEGDLDPVVPAGEGLVDGVVHDLVDEVVEAPETGRADVHARPQPDGLEALENGDVFCCVGRFSH